jgi:hypothetical protein
MLDTTVPEYQEFVVALAKLLLEPLTLPPECPPLLDRLIMAVDDLIKKEFAARKSELEWIDMYMKLLERSKE